MDPRDLQSQDPGYHITAEEWNALVVLARTTHTGQVSVSEAGLQASRYESRTPAPIGVVAWTHVSIDPYSVFKIGKADAGTGETADAIAETVVGAAGVGHGLYTNGSVAIALDSSSPVKFLAYPVEYFRPVKLINSGGLSYGEIGGPDSSMAVASDRAGLLCVAPDVEAGHAWFIRLPDSTMVGKVSTTLTARDGDTLGTGAVTISYRGTSDLANANDPTSGSAPWTLNVYNLSDRAIDVGTYVQVVPVAGIGLAVFDPTPVSVVLTPTSGTRMRFYNDEDTISGGGQTLLEWVDDDVTGDIEVHADGLKVLTAGRYLIELSIIIYTSTPAIPGITVELFNNGTMGDTLANAYVRTGSFDITYTVSFNRTVTLDANDIISAYLTNDDSSAVSMWTGQLSVVRTR